MALLLRGNTGAILTRKLRKEWSEMRKLNLIFISCLVMLWAAAGGAYTQPKPLRGRAPELPDLRTDK